MRGWSHDKQDDATSFRLKCVSARFGWCWSIEGEHASHWAAIVSIAAKIGCTAADAARVGEAGRASTAASGPALRPTMRERLKALERENRELRQANEILRKASAYFAQAELDRRCKP